MQARPLSSRNPETWSKRYRTIRVAKGETKRREKGTGSSAEIGDKVEGCAECDGSEDLGGDIADCEEYGFGVRMLIGRIDNISRRRGKRAFRKVCVSSRKNQKRRV